ncbi:hypothetical protein ACRQ1B_27945 [Rhizobium panacihumi]|uniref:hypothetical protein n=1 Tax=Rhizobium panacihumi TaxID=2008450 RepID=UPI003D7BEB08
MLKFNSTMFEVAGRFMFPARPASSLAQHLGLSRQYVTSLINGRAPIPPSLWPDLERLTVERMTHILRWHERLVQRRKKQRATHADNSSACIDKLSGRDFAALGTALFGEAWTGRMAFHMNRSPEYMRKLAKGERPMREPLWRMLEPICMRQVVQLEFVESRLREFRFDDEIASDAAAKDSLATDDADDVDVWQLINGPTFH